MWKKEFLTINLLATELGWLHEGSIGPNSIMDNLIMKRKLICSIILFWIVLIKKKLPGPLRFRTQQNGHKIKSMLKDDGPLKTARDVRTFAKDHTIDKRSKIFHIIGNWEIQSEEKIRVNHLSKRVRIYVKKIILAWGTTAKNLKLFFIFFCFFFTILTVVPWPKLFLSKF